MQKISFNCYHELPGGYFSKDEQGWCAYFVHIQCEDGENVIFHKYFDANGSISEKTTKNAKIIKIENEDIITIQLDTDDKNFLVYSLKENKILNL
ncbi:MAG: hypothetical protein KatS3mg035_0514 [Bacteroidia bacterium]|nr:MAG: hypothetical protein KatS3mg035_0514 [Bacteroidia bacterium]